MFHKIIRYGLVLIAVGLFAAGCASAQPTVVAPAPPIAPAPATSAAPTAAPASSASSAAPTTASSSAAPSAGAGSAGNTVRLDIVSDKSEARYRVREQLASVSLPSDAVGKTNAISGSIVGKTDGTIVSSQSKFVVDLSKLQSDRAQRDNFLRGNVLQTGQYPDATFVPTSAPGLPLAFPPTGPVAFKLTGDLTIRNVTKPVTWDVTCQPTGGAGTCHATTSFNFEYFNLTQPRVPVVLSVVDNITLELDLTLQPAAA